MPNTLPNNDCLVATTFVLSFFDWSRTTLWRRMKEDAFPKPVTLPGDSPNSTLRWWKSDILKYAGADGE